VLAEAEKLKEGLRAQFRHEWRAKRAQQERGAMQARHALPRQAMHNSPVSLQRHPASVSRADFDSRTAAPAKPSLLEPTAPELGSAVHSPAVPALGSKATHQPESPPQCTSPPAVPHTSASRPTVLSSSPPPAVPHTVTAKSKPTVPVSLPPPALARMAGSQALNPAATARRLRSHLPDKHVRRDCTRACRTFVGSGLSPATSALGLGPFLPSSPPGLRSRAGPLAATSLPALSSSFPSSAPALGSPLTSSAPGLVSGLPDPLRHDAAHVCTVTGPGLIPATSAPRLRSFVPHMPRNWSPLPHLHRGCALTCHICTGTAARCPRNVVGCLSDAAHHLLHVVCRTLSVALCPLHCGCKESVEEGGGEEGQCSYGGRAGSHQGDRGGKS
jgi:hypothetical protein